MELPSLGPYFLEDDLYTIMNVPACLQQVTGHTHIRLNNSTGYLIDAGANITTPLFFQVKLFDDFQQ